MSTRSIVAIFDGYSYLSIYVHHDGYLKGVGQTLFESYLIEEDIRKLISFGDTSGVSKTLVGSKQSSYKVWKNEDCPAQSNYSAKEFAIGCARSGAEFAYVFDTRQQRWFYFIPDEECKRLAENPFTLDVSKLRSLSDGLRHSGYSSKEVKLQSYATQTPAEQLLSKVELSSAIKVEELIREFKLQNSFIANISNLSNETPAQWEKQLNNATEELRRIIVTALTSTKERLHDGLFVAPDTYESE